MVSASACIDNEPSSRRQRYPLLEGQAPEVVCKDISRQTEPNEKAPSRVRPLHINRHVVLQSGERTIAAHFVQRPHALNVLLPRAIPAVLRDNVCCERVRSPAHLRRPAVDTAPDDALGTEQPPQPQAGRKRFGETANAHRLLALRQGVETRRYLPLKRVVAIDIVLHNQEAIVARQPDHLETPRSGQPPPRRVLLVLHGLDHAGYCSARTKPCQLSF